MSNVISLKDIVGKGYKKFWNFKGRYLVVKGGRGSKKSKTTALRWIYLLMKHKDSNLLVIRKTGATLKDSCFADLKWAISRLGVAHLWESTKTPLSITYKPTGQKILFRGLDDPLKITSITVEKGYLNFAWFEEAYEIQSEADFDKIDMSIRGDTKGLFKQIVLTFNPWSDKHWIKKRFFDVEDDNVLALTTTYQCNEFLDESDLKLFDWMKEHNPRRYSIEGLGHWGISEGAIFTNWEEHEFDYQLIAKRTGMKSAFGVDFGYTADPSTLVCSLVDLQNREVYIFDEHYEKAMLNNDIATMIQNKGYSKEKIIADSSEPKSIEEIRRYGVRNIKGAKKGKDSVLNGIQFLQQFKIYVHPRCKNTIIELNNYIWDKDKSGKTLNKPIDDFNHCLDALRYSVEEFNQAQNHIKSGSDIRRMLGL